MQALEQITGSEEKVTHIANSCQINNSTSSNHSLGKLMTLGSEADENEPLSRCDLCHGHTQKDIEILGAMRRVSVVCRCRRTTYEQEEKAAKLRGLKRRAERFKAYSLMDTRFEASTFENWSHRPDNREDYVLGIKYCKSWDAIYANNRGLLLYGKAGSGKTFLSFAIANTLYEQGKAVMAISISKLLAIIKDSFDMHGEFSETDILNAVMDADLLVLDDMGVEYKTAWSYEKLYAIIDTRYRVARPTIITTNYNLSELRENLATVDIKTRARDPSERIFSRISEMCAFYEVKGASWRISKGTQNKAALFNELGLSQKP